MSHRARGIQRPGPVMRQAATVADGDPAARSQVFSSSATTSEMADRNPSRIFTQGSARWNWNLHLCLSAVGLGNAAERPPSGRGRLPEDVPGVSVLVS